MSTSLKFNELKVKLEKYLDGAQIDNIYDAYLFAKHAHNKQFRLSGEPYIIHPLAVSCILADLKLDYQTIMAGLLHDVLEDTKITKNDLALRYGAAVAELVDGVSKLKQLNFTTHAELQAENLRKMMLAMARDIRVIIIKMADRLHNMRTLGALKPDKRRRIARETLDIYAPIANRLGMYYFKVAFENLGFDYLHPMRSRVLREQVNKEYRTKIKLIDNIKKKIAEELDAAKITNYNIVGREKNIYSIYKKMKEKHILFSEIMDIYAFRIEVGSIEDCYRILGLIHSIFKPISNKFKDYIAIPKLNGYQALHTVLRSPYGVPIEIQIRTFEMSNLAENGVAAHWLYKSSDARVTTAQIKAREWFTSLLEMQKQVGDNSLEFIENVKIDLFPDELYVFTPKGEIIKLQIGSTAVDFAYAVHTDIGNTCVATKVDNRLVPLSTVLENGQTIEVITEPNAKPNPAWLSFVQTSKARSNIRDFIRKQKQVDTVALGKNLIHSAFKEINIAWEQLQADDFAKLLVDLNLKTLDDLYQEVGLGDRQAFLVARRFLEILDDSRHKPAINAAQTISMPISIKGTEGTAVSFAECCHPIPGDVIFGIFIEGTGLQVHADTCKQQSMYKNFEQTTKKLNIMPLYWADDCQGFYKVKIIVDVVNQRGMLAKLATAIADSKANIEKLTTEDRDGGLYTVISMLIGVCGQTHLAEVIRNLRKIKDVNKVVRE